jgi:hypothetical protein
MPPPRDRVEKRPTGAPSFRAMRQPSAEVGEVAAASLGWCDVVGPTTREDAVAEDTRGGTHIVSVASDVSAFAANG